METESGATAMFKKGDKVAALFSWDNKGTVQIRRATVHSCGSKIMRLQDEAGQMFKAAYRPENNVMVAFNGMRVIADADDARINALNVAEGERRIATGDAFHVRVGRELIAEQHEPRAFWHGQAAPK